ncbi:MAG: hypothetical protein FWD93_04120, partial [Coriobacteriia bacterium]|nr:hypothetical protein [Coriobacteriia bacterium]
MSISKNISVPQNTPSLVRLRHFTKHDLFYYGISQGLRTLSHMSSYLSIWLNSIWSLDLEKVRTEHVSVAN